MIQACNYARFSYKTVNRNKLKVWQFKSHRFINFSAVKKTVAGVGGRMFFLFLLLSLSVHINFQYKLNSHKSHFITGNLFSSTALLIFLLSVSSVSLFLKFSSYILWITVNKFSPWQCLIWCLISIEERANKYKLFSIFNRKSTSKQKHQKTFFI